MLDHFKIILLNQNEEIPIPWKLNRNRWGYIAFVGMTAYFTDSVNLSVPTFFYGVPIFLIGLGLKTSEIPPVELLDKANFAANKFNRPKELTALVKDLSLIHI